jgi:DNA polymerase
VTNVVNWRPEGNRKPTDDEIAHCLPYLEKHIQLLDPKLIATFGSTSAFAILSRARFDSTSFRIGPLIAKTYQYKNFFSRKEYSIFVMYHPSYMMRKRNDEGQFREQFAVLKRRFNELSK